MARFVFTASACARAEVCRLSRATATASVAEAMPEVSRWGWCNVLLTPAPCLCLACALLVPAALAGLRLSAGETGFGRQLSAFAVRRWGGGKGAKRPQTWQLIPVCPCDIPQISVLPESGWMFSGMRLIRGDSERQMGKRGHRRNLLPPSEPGRGFPPVSVGGKARVPALG